MNAFQIRLLRKPLARQPELGVRAGERDHVTEAADGVQRSVVGESGVARWKKGQPEMQPLMPVTYRVVSDLRLQFRPASAPALIPGFQLSERPSLRSAGRLAQTFCEGAKMTESYASTVLDCARIRLRCICHFSVHKRFSLKQSLETALARYST